MSHKTHPKILRIAETKDWLSRGFYEKSFAKYLEEDFKIRKFLKDKLPKGITDSIEIERERVSLKIIIKTSRPALIIGRGGEGVEKLKGQIKEFIWGGKGEEDIEEKPKNNIKIEILAVKNVWASASLDAQWIVFQIEKRMPYRRVLKMALDKIMVVREIKGARVEVAGRLNGVSIHRTEWLQKGELPRQRIKAIIDYGFAEAHCTYGLIGVKVWLYKGEND